MRTEEALMKHVLQVFADGYTPEKLFGNPVYADSEVHEAVEEAMELGYLCAPGHREHEGSRQ